MSATVMAPRIPLHEIGWFDVPVQLEPRMYSPSPVVYAPEIPLRELGWLGQTAAKVVGASAPIAAMAVTAALTPAVAAGGAAAGAGGGAAAGSWAGPIGAAVGVAIGLIAGLLAAHAVRAKQAKDENSAMNIGVQSFDSDLQKIQQAFNAGQMSANDAMRAVEIALQGYWTIVTPHIQPARNGCNSGGSCPAPPLDGRQYCQGDIGAACCVGCVDLAQSINASDGVIAAILGTSTAAGGPNTANIIKVYGSKYGGSERAAYTLEFKAPPAPTGMLPGSAVDSLHSLTSSIESVFAPSASGSGTGTSLLPLLLLAGAAWLVLR